MIKVENIDVWGFEGALRGMRNPMDSWHLSDSCVCDDDDCARINNFGYECTDPAQCYNGDSGYCIGMNDMDLMKRLFKAGTEHRKYLRMIHVQMDIVAPLYWWSEYDTYKVGTTANSCSKMHKLHTRDLTMADFSTEHLLPGYAEQLKRTINEINHARQSFVETGDKKYWWQMIQLLPNSYNQRRTVDMNYETVLNIIRQRTGHKLDEWNDFVKILTDLPYVEELLK